MPFVMRTPSSSWMGTFIGLREQVGHFLVRLGTTVAIKLPNVAHFANHVQVQVGDDHCILVTRTFRDNLAARIGEVALAVEFTKVPGFLRPDAIDGADVEYVGHRRGGLFEFPQVFAEACHRGAGIEDDLGAVESEKPPAFGEVTVIAGINAHFANGGLKYGIAEVAGLEVKLLPEAGLAMRDVVLAILAEILAIGIDDGGRVVVGARGFFLVHGDDDHHPVLLRESLHQFCRRTVRDSLGRLIPLDLLFTAEVRAVKNLLHAEHLHAFFCRLLDHLHVLLDHRLLDLLDGRCARFGVGRLNQSATYDECHGALSSINVRLSPYTRVIVEYGLQLREEVQPFVAHFAAAVAGRLESAERQLRFATDGRRVDVYHARVDPVREPHHEIRVAGVNRTGQSELHVVGDGHGLLEIVYPEDGQHRAEDFLLRQRVFGLHVVEYGRHHEITLPEFPLGKRRAADQTLVALLLGNLDITQVGLILRLVYRRSHVDPVFRSVAHLDLLHAVDQFFEKLVRNGLVQNHAAGRGAALSCRAESALRTAFDGEVEIGIVHHHQGVFAAHLARDLRQMGSGLLGHLSASFTGAGKRDCANGLVVHELIADGAAAAIDQVQHAFWQAGIFINLRKQFRAAGRVGRGLEDHGVGGDQRWCGFPYGNTEGEIPGCDAAHHAEWLANRVHECAGHLAR